MSDRRQPAERCRVRIMATTTPIEETAVFIAIVDFSTAAADRPTALACLDSERDEIRAMPGNLAFRVHASREDDGRLTIVHEWDDEVSFGGYLRSGSFARFGEVLRPIANEAPVSRRFHAEQLRDEA